MVRYYTFNDFFGDTKISGFQMNTQPAQSENKGCNRIIGWMSIAIIVLIIILCLMQLHKERMKKEFAMKLSRLKKHSDCTPNSFD
jgi:hypothetical protein